MNPSVHDAWWFLTPRERLFVTNLVAGMEYRDAYTRAGYGTGANYYHLMKRPLIRAALYQKVSEAFKEGSIEAGQWVREIATIAFMPSHMLAGPPTWDHKLKALELLGKYQKWLTENKNIRVDFGLAKLFGAATQAIMHEASATHTVLPTPVNDPLATEFAEAVLVNLPSEGKS